MALRTTFWPELIRSAHLLDGERAGSHRHGAGDGGRSRWPTRGQGNDTAWALTKEMATFLVP